VSQASFGAGSTKNMSHLPGGRYLAGDDRFYPEEAPVFEADVDPLWVDEHPVTNAEFRRFVKATGHVTVAEIAPSADEFPDATDEQLQPGSLVFQPSAGPVPLDDWTRWWRWVPGADWRHPFGPGSTLHGLDRHPVVHVGFEDAAAYAEWAGKELPTEVEWEYAARGGLEQATYAWGEEFTPHGKVMANTWHGRFPWENLAPLGFTGTSPVGRFPANGYHLLDMIGNVWEWTCSAWTDARRTSSPPATSEHTMHSCCAPAAQLTEEDRRVTKGGSYLCAPSYCLRYRPAARQGHTVRSSTGHLGFRCIVRG
jgi:formylglycine-generating enzyme required for sulfatase activity